MSLATVYSRTQNGLNAELVTVEVHLAPGLPGLNIVGLPEAAVREAKDRVKAALQTCGYQFPNRRMTCNLAPADLPKEGARFDLAIALGILAASGQVPGAQLSGLEVLGELSLSGEIRPVRGALPASIQATRSGRSLIVPEANADEALLAANARVFAVRQLGELCAALHQGTIEPERLESRPRCETAAITVPDLSEVRGQKFAKRALEIAAAGGHSLLMVGPPGSGKSLLAARLPGLMPAMSESECIEVAAVGSIGLGGFDVQNWGQRPYRAPHHSASGAALVGGGSIPRPGEITLAHLGVLFLDELPEFDRKVLEVLREPLESGHVTVSRAARQAEFPARFQLIAAMNPCPCGYQGDSSGKCRCTPDQVFRYRGKISGPLMDRIDMQLFVPRVETRVLMQDGSEEGESSASVRERVDAANSLQLDRQGSRNAALTPKQVEQLARPDDAGRALLEQAMSRFDLSARAYHRILKVARTIADLGGSDTVASQHIAESLRFRQLDQAGTS